MGRLIKLYLRFMAPILNKVNPEKKLEFKLILMEALILGLPLAIVYTLLFYLFYLIIQ